MFQRLAALLIIAALLPIASFAQADPVVAEDAAVTGVLNPGQTVFLASSGADAVTVTYTTTVLEGEAPATLLRISCFFWCSQHEKEAARAGQEVLFPWEGGETLYLVAPEGSAVAFTATVTPGHTGLGICSLPDGFDFCTPDPV